MIEDLSADTKNLSEVVKEFDYGIYKQIQY